MSNKRRSGPRRQPVRRISPEGVTETPLVPTEEEKARQETSLIDPRTACQDIKLLRRAIREDWPMSPEVRKMVMNQLAIVVGTSGEQTRSRVAAAKALIAADSVNVKREALDQADAHKAAPSTHLHVHQSISTDDQRSRLSAIAERLGIGINPNIIDANEAGGSAGAIVDAGK